MRNLKTVLTNEFGINQLSNWTLTSANGISGNGKTIVGSGINHVSGLNEGWVVVLAEPSSLALFTLASLMLTRRRYVW